MISGLTHNENGELNKVTKYKGKISSGFSPGEGPNKENHPIAAGFFRILKEVIKNQRIGRDQKVVALKEWVLNEPIQALLEKSCNGSKQPRRIEIVCLYKEFYEMWESSLGMYSGTEGLVCKGHGPGSDAKLLTFNGSERVWTKRPCLYEDCPDYKAGKCKPLGLMKCFPSIDLAPNPYRFETRSKNTIVGIESSFSDLMTLVRAAHMVKQIEAGKQLPFDGLFGAKLFLIHRKVKSGGNNVFITDMEATPEYTESIMEPIKRGLAAKAKQSMLIGEAGSISLLGEASERLLESSRLALAETVSVDDAVPVDLDSQCEIAVNFGSDAGDVSETEVPEETPSNPIPEDLSKKASETLIGETSRIKVE